MLRPSLSRSCLLRQFHHTVLKYQLKIPTKQTLLNKFQFQEDTISIKDFIKRYEQGQGEPTKSYLINGWIDSPVKKIGNKLYFTTLRDPQGNKIQLVDKHEPSLLKGCISLESCIQIQGSLKHKKQPMNQEPGKSGQEYEIVLHDVRCLNRAGIKPSQLIDKKGESSIFPAEYRYLQLRVPSEQNLLKKRFEVNYYMRQWLYNNKFMEIETPILFKPTPEGAREFVVPTRQLDQTTKRPLFYSLTQSPQQYKQLLMASGIPRYFQFAKCFRDEDLRKDRQPEFTQLDMELSFAKGSKVRSLIQDLIIKVWSTESKNKSLFTWDSQKLIDCKEQTSLNSITYNDVMSLYGIDKPNLIAPNLKIVNLTELTGAKSQDNPKFPIIEAIVLKNVLKKANYEDDYRNHWKPLLHSNNYNYRSPFGIPITNEETCQNWYKNIPMLSHLGDSTQEQVKKMNRSLSLSLGDIVFISNREPDQAIFENPTPLGRLRQLILNQPETAKLFRETPGSKDDVAIWVVNFPLFSPVETENQKGAKYPTYIEDQYVSTHHPFTMVKLSTLDHLKKEPLKCIGQHYDLVMNGVELGGGSQRVHDPELQDYIFKHVLKIENSHKLFGHLLEAFETGTPPHSGFAIGFDRMCSMLFNRESIRDVIAFPKSITGADQLVKSPALVDDAVLKDYHVLQASPKPK
ncbi:aspartate--tRNA ligase, mitochondrial [Monosporozyma unispora]